ncbi:MAG: Ig-like domain-containing protein, partial [Campylobacterales bacterium]|nr:Ig-like domain-containing protein [Campylobacterales bacterium]
MSKLYIRDSNGNVESIRLQKHSLINAKQGDKLFFTNQYDSFYFKMLNNDQDLQIIFKTGNNILSFIVKKIINLINVNYEEGQDLITGIIIANTKDGLEKMNDRLYDLDLDDKTIFEELEDRFNIGKNKDGILIDNLNDLRNYIDLSTFIPTLNNQIEYSPLLNSSYKKSIKFIYSNNYEIETLKDVKNILNPSTLDERKVYIDTHVPSIHVKNPELKNELDSGFSNKDNITNITKPVFDVFIQKDAKEGDVIKLYDKDTLVSLHELTKDDITKGKIEISIAEKLDGTIDSNLELKDGKYEFSTTTIDENGNESEKSPIIMVTIDTLAKAPEVIRIKDDKGSIQTDLNNNDVSDDSKPRIELKLLDDVKLGDVIKLYDGVTEIASHIITQNEIDNKKAEIEPIEGLTEGKHELSTSISDKAGNESSQTTPVTITVDTISPIVPTVVSVVTEDTTPVINGTASLEDGETLSVSVNGATYNVTPDSNGNWSIDTDTPVSGSLLPFVAGHEYEVVATVTDEAGNSSSDLSTNEITIDVVDNTTTKTPTIDSLITNDDTPVISGTATVGA